MDQLESFLKGLMFIPVAVGVIWICGKILDLWVNFMKIINPDDH